MAEDQVTGLGERGLDGVVFEYSRSSKRRENDWWVMALYAGTCSVYSLYQSDAAKCPNERPNPTDDVSDILARFVPVT